MALSKERFRPNQYTMKDTDKYPDGTLMVGINPQDSIYVLCYNINILFLLLH